MTDFVFSYIRKNLSERILCKYPFLLIQASPTKQFIKFFSKNKDLHFEYDTKNNRTCLHVEGKYKNDTSTELKIREIIENSSQDNPIRKLIRDLSFDYGKSWYFSEEEVTTTNLNELLISAEEYLSILIDTFSNTFDLIRCPNEILSENQKRILRTSIDQKYKNFPFEDLLYFDNSLKSKLDSICVFYPWVGKSYFSSNNAFGKRILMIGQSHYCGADGSFINCGLRENKCSLGNTNWIDHRDLFYKYCPFANRNFTRVAVKDWYLGEKKGFANNWRQDYYISEGYLPCKKNLTSKEKWDNIAFFNFIQTAYNGSQKSGSYTKNDYENSYSIVKSLIQFLKPQVIIVWGQTVYYHLKKALGSFNIKEQKFHDTKTDVNFFIASFKINSEAIKVFVPYHPSQKNFNTEKNQAEKFQLDFISEEKFAYFKSLIEQYF